MELLDGHTAFGPERPQQKMILETMSAIGARSQRKELRSAPRYPIIREVCFSVVDEPGNSGRGHTLNISSGGVLFTTPRPLGTGDKVELAVSWPAKLGGDFPLKLIIAGQVVRSDGASAAITIEKYEFRLRRGSDLDHVADGKRGIRETVRRRRNGAAPEAE